MNILFINSIGKKKFGGGEKWMIKSARGLSEAGHNVFLASKKGAKILRVAKQTGIKTVIFNIYADFSLLNTYWIYKFLKKNNIQILICNLNKDVRVAGLAARLLKTPVVIARHGMLLCGKKWKHKITLHNLVDGILTNTNTVKESYLNYGWFPKDYIKVIYNGIEEKNNVPDFDFSQKFPSKKIILSAGRLTEQKGFEFLIEAAKILSAKRQDLIFIVCGNGRLKNDLNMLIRNHKIEDSFFLWGFIENMDPLLKSCDLFVLTSLFEGMPNVVMEAMAVGKAVIATDVNGVRELMEDKKTGIIIPSKNMEVLAEKIDELIDNNELLEQFGQQGKIKVKENFTIQLMVKNLEKYFNEKLIEKRNKVTNSKN